VKYEPQLATLAKQPPAGDAWLHEIKYDGYRMGCAIAADGVRLTSRNGLDYTSALPELVAEAKALPVTSALLDGEVVVLLEDGRASFQALQQAMSDRKARAGLVYLVFDLLEVDGEPLLEQPLEARKDRLRRLVSGAAKRIRYSDHVIGHGDAFFAQATKLGVEGIVSKRRDGVYQPGRRSGWLKIKCLRERPFVVGGYTDQEGMMGGLGALLVGHYDETGRLTFAGRVGTGFTQKISRGLLERLRPLARRTSPFDPPPAGPLARTAHFVEPALVCRVAFAEWTDDDKIRHPVYRGLAEDVDPRGVARDFTDTAGLRPRPT
jgi:bifunctional non-homologous end joining protein LigD